MSWFETAILGLAKVLSNGTLLTRRSSLNFKGAVVTDNPGLDATDIELAAVFKANYTGELTIASGVITVTGPGFYTLDTEGDAATDEIHTINGGQDGDLVFLRPAAAARLPIFRRYDASGLPSGANIVVTDYWTLETSTVGVMMVFDQRHLSGAGAWLPMAPRGDYVTAYRQGRRFQLGAIAAAAQGTASAGGGTLTKVYNVSTNKVCDFTWHVHGRQNNTGYAFMAMGRATAGRATGSLQIWQDDAGVSTAVTVQKCLVDPDDGTDQGALADDIAITVDTSGPSFRVTITNNDSSNDLALTGAGIAIGAHVYDLEALS